ncbi:MAG: S41 family peptidase [Patescibacteria group bacterium]|nr:MAG: S41 family peptidase [Patescibacteria group bacterium]
MKSIVRILIALVFSFFMFATVGAPQESVAVSGLFSKGELRKLHFYKQLIQKRGVIKGVTNEKLLDRAIRGMLRGQDPHSGYVSKDEYEDRIADAIGKFGGVGISVIIENGVLKVIAPIDGAPADRAGVKTGDLIVRVNRVPVRGMSTMEVAKIIRGKPGTNVTLTIIRKGEPKLIVITLTREIIKIVSVKSRMLEKGFGYVRISSFGANTADDLLSALKALEKENGGPLAGLVLDLRNNPGGLVSSAQDVASTFLGDPHMKIVTFKERTVEYSLFATADDALGGAPLVVLVNGGSASASELVAAALQDNGRALIVGLPTFGKGSAQATIRYRDGSAAHLTIGLFYRPSGEAVQVKGITPDVVLENITVAKSDLKKTRLREKDLMRHLGNPDADANAAAKKEKRRTVLAKEDFQLYRTLDLLKGIALYHKK